MEATKSSLEQFKIKMDFSLKLLHKVIDNEDTEEILQKAIEAAAFSEEELAAIKEKIAKAASSVSEDDKINDISSLREYLFQLLD